MEDKEIINLWKAQDTKIEQSLAINKQLLLEVIHQKAKSALQSLKVLKTRGIIALVIYLIILGNILFWAISNYSSALNYFIFSLSAIFLINVKALSDYVRHLVMASNIRYEGSVSEIQEQLTMLQMSIIKHAKMMCLQFPFFTTFFLSNTWFPQEVGWGYVVFQVALTGVFVYLSYWLYKNQTMENLDKKWFQQLISGSGGKSVMKALVFYKELEAFKREG